MSSERKHLSALCVASDLGLWLLLACPTACDESERDAGNAPAATVQAPANIAPTSRGVPTLQVASGNATPESTCLYHGATEPDLNDLRDRPATRVLWTEGPETRMNLEVLQKVHGFERVALGYLSALVAHECTWSLDQDGELECPLTCALGLGYQCAATTHREFLAQAMGTQGLPERCDLTPNTATSRSFLDEIRIQTTSNRVSIEYSAWRFDSDTRNRRDWTETLTFGAKDGHVRLESRSMLRDLSRRLPRP
jgi:hypothetical protein